MQGTRLGTYVLEDKIGEGGMGVVYTATDTRLKRKAVIKMLHKHLADHREIAKRFQNEAIAAAGIGHPGIVEIYDTGYADDGSLYIVMELLRGQSLQDRLDQAKTIEVDSAIAIIRQCASALSAAHESGIIHRDLKPDNIFLEVDAAVIGGERAKLLDFGIAKLAGANAASMLTATGMTMGTAYYMSPEQCKDAGGVDHRTDLYALGCILFQLLTGRFVFPGTSNNQLIIAHTVEPPPRVRSLNPDISPALEQIVSTLLAKEPDKRFANAEALITALDGLSANDGAPRPVAKPENAHLAATNMASGAKPKNAHLAATNVASLPPDTGEPLAKPVAVPATTLGVGSGEIDPDVPVDVVAPTSRRRLIASALTVLLLGGAASYWFLGNDGASAVIGAADSVLDAGDPVHDATDSVYEAAEQGNAIAQFELGVRYYEGNGIQEDKVKAIQWYRKAAEQGDANAQSNLGLMYANGEGVKEDHIEALQWYRKAAEQGNATAQFELGVGYAIGNGLEKDMVEALQWYRKAAAQGSAEAQYNLGKMYDDGSGVKEDDAEAVNWYRKAAEQGDSDAQANLGIMYDEGTGVTEDDVEAVKWYRKAAEQGSANAQAGLAFMYYEGNGITKDAVEAVKWYRKAAAQGHANAQANLDILLKD